MTTYYNYTVSVWMADPENLQESKGNLLDEFSSRHLDIALSHAYAEVFFAARELEDDALVLEVRKVPVSDAVGNPI